MLNNRKNKDKNKKIIITVSIVSVVLLVMFIIPLKKVKIVVDNEEKIKYTLSKTYNDLIKNQDIDLTSEDYVSVALDDKVKDDSIIIINKSKDISVNIDGTEHNFKTNKSTWEEALAQLDIEYNKDYIMSLDIKENIKDGDYISVTSVDVIEEEVVEHIEADEVILKDYKSELGDTKLISEGSPGEIKKTYKVKLKGGEEVSREIIKEEVICEPEDRIISEGLFDPNSISVCVNQQRMLDPSYEPYDLVVPNVRTKVSEDRIMLREEASEALEKLFKDAEKDDVYLYAVSGYRSYSYQYQIHDPFSGESAPPGASEHQLGLAIDVNDGGSDLTTDFANTEQGKWIEENAHKYGFLIRYLDGKQDITGYTYEPWHLRYLGVDLATKVKKSGLTLEEYYSSN